MSKQLPVESVMIGSVTLDNVHELMAYAGIQGCPTGSHHKFNRVAGSCECTVCGQGEAFAAHGPPIPRRPNLKEMHDSWQQAKREAEVVVEEVNMRAIKRERNGRRRKSFNAAEEVD